MNKKAKTDTITWVILIGIVAIFGISAGVIDFSAISGDEVQEQPTTITTCESDVTPDLDINGYDIANPGTAITENFAYRKVGGVAWTTGTLGTALTNLEVGATYEIVPGIDASNGIDNPYGEMFTHKIKCQETESIDVPLYNDEVEASLTATFYNADDNAAAETFVAGQTQTVSIKFEAGTDEAFGNPFLDMPNVLVIKLNSSQWDVPEKVYLKDGTTLSRVTVPLRYDVEALGGTDFTEYAYEFPAVIDEVTQVYLRLNADDTNAPGSGGSAADGTAYLFAGTYFIQEDASIGIGVETEEGVDIAVSDSDSVTLDFT